MHEKGESSWPNRLPSLSAPKRRSKANLAQSSYRRDSPSGLVFDEKEFPTINPGRTKSGSCDLVQGDTSANHSTIRDRGGTTDSTL